jgi:hypothetical protein
MPKTIHTTTSFRLTRDEAMLIRPGLFRIVVAHRRWKNAGQDFIPPGSCTPLPAPKAAGRYGAEQQAIILHVVVTATNSFQARSRRLRMDSFEIAACILGVRATVMMCRHGHLTPCPADYKVHARRLLKKLERLRKRAKRAYIRVHGQPAYAEASQHWLLYVRFVRRYFLYCSCNRFSKWVKGLRETRRPLVNEWIRFFRKELPELELKIPPDRTLRDLVMQALRSSRKALRYYGRVYFHNRPGVMRERIRLFVVKRCLKARTAK